MSFKTPIICDRRVYDKKGKWKNPNNDIYENIFYFIEEPLTLVPSYENGREEMKETMTITIFGDKPIIKEDSVLLHNGQTLKVQTITLNYIEESPFLKDMLKPRVASMTLTLE